MCRKIFDHFGNNSNVRLKNGNTRMDVIPIIVTRYVLLSRQRLNVSLSPHVSLFDKNKIFSSSTLSEELKIHRKTISDSNIVCIFEPSRISFGIGLLSLRGEASGGGFLQSQHEVILRILPIKIDFPPARDISSSSPILTTIQECP